MQPSIIRTTIFSIVSDLIMLTFILALCLGFRAFLGGQIGLEVYYILFVYLILVLPIYAIFGLYPPILLSSPDILRRLTFGTTTLFLILFTITFFFRTAEDYSRFALFLAWILAIVIMPIWRGIIKRHFSKYRWWGNEIILFGSQKWVESTARSLMAKAAVGLKPCGAVLFDENKLIESCRTETQLEFVAKDGGKLALPLLSLQDLPDYARSFSSPYAFIDMHSLSPKAHKDMVKLSCYFKKTFFAFSFLEHLNCWSDVTDLGDYLVLETRQKLLDVRRQYVKRAIDLLLTLFGAFAFVPIALVVAILIKKEDGGPVFYSQKRIGKDGKVIKILKFRTMVMNADKILEEYLTKNPELAKEWEENHKLKNDPRITKLGLFLRKSSLDELPQVWNVFKGDLSFVGPRPIVEEEREKYGEEGLILYQRVLPGLTGYWQISGRSNTSYEERVTLDSYYIRNWSVWMDIYIIACTPRAVLQTTDAY